jgi:copper chaperone NosL
VNYSTPGNLLSAAAAFYVQGGEVESPMGGNLAAFNTEEAAKKFATENHAKLLHWNEVKQLEF